MADFEADLEKCKKFLQNYVSVDGSQKYMEMLQAISNRGLSILKINLDDLSSYEDDDDLVESVLSNTKRYVKLFQQAADDVMPMATAFQGGEDAIDMLNNQRRDNMRLHAEQEGGREMPLPASLLRRYQVVFVPPPKSKILPLRKIGAAHVGKLVTCQGIVVRCTDVKPQCTVAAYICTKCGQETFQEITGREYKPIERCGDKEDANSCKGHPVHHPKYSKFVKFQEIKLQELAHDVPQGSVPRTMTVHAHGELTRIVKPGEMVTITGIFLPVPFTGYKALKAGLLTQTFLEAMQVQKEKVIYSAVTNSEIEKDLRALRNSPNGVYDKIAKSIAPEIYGHEDVKKVLLLMMLGGVTKTTADGMRMRGDIHVCLMGDPGVAKSQLLKQVATIAPRSVYTTGKGSSGVGLTAAVQRDPVTGEMVLEGGALVLADKGICCIDEFDKMEEQDRTAIHEAMEQQTVSIAKGGITTTLNTRASVLAAANPAGGSYDPSLTPEQNINLPAALLSRFDFLWLMLDRPNEEDDKMLADHVLKIHRTCNHLGMTEAEMMEYEENPSLDDRVSTHVIRAFVAEARKHDPVVPEELLNDITEIYTSMRRNANGNQVVTARQLQSILRMSQALARLRLDDYVAMSDLNEAQRLLTASRESLSAERSNEQTDMISAIYGRIAQYVRLRKEELIQNRVRVIVFADIAKVVRRSNLPCSDAQIREALAEYAELGVWSLAENSFDIVLSDENDLGEALIQIEHAKPVKKKTGALKRRKEDSRKRKREEAAAREADGVEGEEAATEDQAVAAS